MKTRTVFLALLFGIIAMSVMGQSINLNDLIQCHKKGIQELTVFLKNKSSSWIFKGHDDGRNWWEYHSDYTSTILYKLDGGFDESEIILVTDDTDITKTIFADVKKNNMKSINNKAMYLGANYFVFFISVEDKEGKTVWRISLLTKNAYLNSKERFNK